MHGHRRDLVQRRLGADAEAVASLCRPSPRTAGSPGPAEVGLDDRRPLFDGDLDQRHLAALRAAEHRAPSRRTHVAHPFRLTGQRPPAAARSPPSYRESAGNPSPGTPTPTGPSADPASASTSLRTSVPMARGTSRSSPAEAVFTRVHRAEGRAGRHLTSGAAASRRGGRRRHAGRPGR